MARLRNATTAQQPAIKAPPSRAALKEKTNTTRTRIPVYENDGNTEDLVKDAKPRRGRPRKVQQNAEEEFMMVGGLGPETSDAPAAVPSDIATTTDELAKGDIVPPPAAKPNRRPPRTVKKIVQSDNQAKVLEGLKQRMEATAREKRAKQMKEPAPVASESAVVSSDAAVSKTSAARKSKDAVERSEFSISPSPPPPGKLSTTKKRASIVKPGSAIKVPGSAMKVHNTPSVETSMMALKNFKRRPRQPSMLQMVQQRTASARPSMTNTAMNDTAVEDPSVFDLDLDTDEEDDFAPEAEGTPLNTAKTSRLSIASTRASTKPKAAGARTSAVSKKRKSDTDVSSGSLNALRAKRQRPTVDSDDNDNIVVASKPTAAPTSSARAETPRPNETSDVQVANSPSSTPPTEPSSSRHSTTKVQVQDSFAVPSTEPEDQEDHLESDAESETAVDAPNGTMAEPASSSPAAMDPPPSTDVLADPATQLSPVPVKSRPKKRQKERPMVTSMLQSLLPKRRQPLRHRERKSAYDMASDSGEDSPLDTSHLEEDEDELGGSVRRPKASALPKATGGKRGRSGKAATTAKKKLTSAAARKSSAAPKGKKTYGRASAASDKENEDYESPGEEDESTLPDVSLSMHDAVQSKEIEDAKKKFAEVDEWDMEFESMSNDFHRSSSQEWR